MEPAGLAVGLAGLSPLASKFGALSRFLYKAAADKGEIREEIESFALRIKVIGDALFVASKKLEALPRSVQSSSTCRHLQKQETLKSIGKSIEEMGRGVDRIFPKLNKMTKHMSLWSKFRWIAEQKHQLWELTQDTVPIQLSLGLILDVIKLERDQSEKASTRHRAYQRRLNEDM